MRPIPCCLLPRVSHLSSLSWHSRLLKQRRIPERALLTAAARTLNVLNVSSSSIDLGLAALCFLRAAFFSARFPRRFFRANPPPFTQFQVFSTQVLAFVLPTCWVKHSQHASTSPSSTLLLTRVCPPSIPTLLASGPTLSAAAVYQLCCRGKRFHFVGLHRHQSTMLLAGLHCQHRRVRSSIDVMKGYVTDH